MTSYRRNILIMTAVATCLAACNVDDGAVLNDGGNLRFLVTTDGASPIMTADSAGLTTDTRTIPYTTATFAESFHAYALEMLTYNYVDLGNATKNGSIWKTGTVNWAFPTDDSAVNFYALWPTSTPFSADWHQHIYRVTYTGDGDPANQRDLLYAFATGQKGSVNGSDGNDNRGVVLNFRHALSRLSFSAVQNSSFTADGSNVLSVTVNSLQLVNVATAGTFLMPYATTSSVPADGDYHNSFCTWTPGAQTATATPTMATAPVALTATPQVLNSEDGKLMLVPQTLKPWNYQVRTVAENDASAHGCYLKIGCTIKISANSTDTYYVGSNSASGFLYFPFTDTWQPGTKYDYRLVFGGGLKDDGSGTLDLTIDLMCATTPIEDFEDGGILENEGEGNYPNGYPSVVVNEGITGMGSGSGDSSTGNEGDTIRVDDNGTPIYGYTGGAGDGDIGFNDDYYQHILHAALAITPMSESAADSSTGYESDETMYVNAANVVITDFTTGAGFEEPAWWELRNITKPLEDVGVGIDGMGESNGDSSTGLQDNTIRTDDNSTPIGGLGTGAGDGDPAFTPN